MKETVNLLNWQLHHETSDEIVFYLTGTAERHPKLGSNAVLAFTSNVVDFDIDREEKKVTFETMNTKYVCSFKFFDASSGMSEIGKVKGADAKTRALINFSNECVRFNKYVESYSNIKSEKDRDSAFEEWIELLRVGADELHEKLLDLHKELIAKAELIDNSLYVDISSISNGANVACCINGKASVLELDKSLSRCIYSLSNGDKIFEYDSSARLVYEKGEEPVSFEIDILYVSSDIDTICIHNSKGRSIRLNTPKQVYKIGPDETTAFKLKP